MKENLKPAAIGALAGLLVFAGLTAAQAFRNNQSFSIAEFRAQAAELWGKPIEINGLVRSPRQHFKYVGRDKIPAVSFSLYEPGDGKSKYSQFGKHSISVTVPADQFRFLPEEGSQVSVTGVVQPPLVLGTLEPQ